VPKSTRGRARKRKSAARYLFYALTFAIIAAALVLMSLYSGGSVPTAVLDADFTICLSLLMPFAVFSYLLAKGQSLKAIIKNLGLSRNSINSKSLLAGLALFALIVVMELLISAFSQATGVQLPTNVAEVLDGMPIYFLLFTFIIAPIDEEILFRGFLVPRFGIIASALLFAVMHLTYLSVSQFVAAFVFGLLAGYFFKKNNSLYTTILAHALVNFLTIAAMFLLIV
jgi:uncharacterized protein